MLTLGVTGTLDAISESEQNIIQDVFKIRNFTYIPSIYGDSNLIFEGEERIRIFNTTDYFMKITDWIKHKLRGPNGGQRAVLVFFKSEGELKKFV
jgi:hypothetical protein